MIFEICNENHKQNSVTTQFLKLVHVFYLTAVRGYQFYTNDDNQITQMIEKHFFFRNMNTVLSHCNKSQIKKPSWFFNFIMQLPLALTTYR